MRILLVHSYYQQPGGEDVVFEAEKKILKDAGHQVFSYSISNNLLKKENRLKIICKLFWNHQTYKKLRRLISKVRPDVAHFHNIFPLMSPSVYYACAAEKIPVVQSLHNPRLMCPAGSFYRAGSLCTKCLGKAFAWPGIYYKCYHNSYLQTTGLASMVFLHRFIHTWQNRVGIYIIFTNFYKKLFIQGGIPVNKIMIKSHSIQPDPGKRITNGQYALFIGRLDPEKGIRTLINAWEKVANPKNEYLLLIRGEGQLKAELEQFIKKNHMHSIRFINRLNSKELMDLIKNSCFLVWPSEGYFETFGLVAVEAFACGVPVIAAKTGVLTNFIADGKTGLHFQPGNAIDLAGKIEWLLLHPEKCIEMGKNARKVFEEKYTSEKNLAMMINIYKRAIHEY